jgi:hypothetical protein
VPARGHDEVAGHRDLKAAADPEAIDRGHGDLVELLECVRHRLIETGAAHHAVRIAPPMHLGDVVAGAICIAPAPWITSTFTAVDRWTRSIDSDRLELHAYSRCAAATAQLTLDGVL